MDGPNGLYDKALKICIGCLKKKQLKKEEIEKFKKLICVLFANKGSCFIKQKNYLKAIDHLEMTLKYDPSSKNKSKYQARIEFARKELLKRN